MGQFCPSCGINLAADEPVSIGTWSVSPSEVLCDGREVRMTPSERIFLHSLAAMRGRVVKDSAILERIGSDAESHVVNVYACRIRRSCRAAGVPDPIETVWGSGYRWREAA